MSKFFGKEATQFAIRGERSAIPEGTQTDGKLSYESGFGSRYSLDLTADKNAITINRQQFNQLLYEITSSIGQLQQQGMWSWQGGITYKRGMQVLYGDDCWICKIQNVDSVPGPNNGNWLRCVELFDQVGASSMYQVYNGTVLTAPSKGSWIFITGYWRARQQRVDRSAGITVTVNGIGKNMRKTGKRGGSKGHSYDSNFYMAFSHMYQLGYNKGDGINISVGFENVDDCELYLTFLK